MHTYEELFVLPTGFLRAAVGATLAALPLAAPCAATDICGQTTQQLHLACQAEVEDDFRVARAKCLNTVDPVARQSCLADADDSRLDSVAECGGIRLLRQDVCAELGPGPYDPVLKPANFVGTITNRYAPFKPGKWWEYRKQTDEGVERVRVEVLDQRRQILGIQATVVRDRVWLDGELVEDTIDWLAQDRQGNVWYLGELARNYEDGRLESLDGSWEAGKNGAKPGLWMTGAPKVELFYRQEWDPGSAEDVVEVESVNAPDDVPFRNSKPVLMTEDWTPLSPDGLELKFYVPGVGFVMEVEVANGETLRLVDYSR